MSFSAHADAKGIMQLIDHLKPENVMFVHGENQKMEILKVKVEQVSKKVIIKLSFFYFSNSKFPSTSLRMERQLL
jgi:Cft2 family RNA processing exonuclease